MENGNFFNSLRKSKGVHFVVLLALIQTVLFDVPARAGIPCELLVRNLGRKIQTALQTVRPARIPGLGRYKSAWDRAYADEIYNSIPDTPEGRQEYMDKFTAQGLEGKTTFEESMVALRITHPVESREWWEILTDADLIVARKRLHLNPVRLLGKLMRKLLNNETVELSPKEQIYLNKLVLKKKNYLITKVTYPRRVTNVEAHLTSLVELAIKIKTKKGNPIRAIIKFINAFQDAQFKKDLSGTLLDVSYGLTKDEYEAPPLSPIRQGSAAFFGEVEADRFQKKKEYLDFLNGITDPEKFLRYNTNITTLDMLSYKYYGPAGLLDALREERGNLAAINQFRKIISFAAVFKALLLVAAVSVMAGQLFFLNQAGGAGAGSQVNSNSYGQEVSLNPPLTPEDDADSDGQILEAGSFNAIGMPELFEDRQDPGHPERNLSPCDPRHIIREKVQALRKTGKYKDDIELSIANPNLEIEAILQVQTLAKDPQTGCLDRFIKVFLEAN